MNKLSFLTRTSLMLGVFFAIDKVLAFGKALLFNRIVGLEGMGIFGAANNIPDYLSALLSGGALGLAFIPVLREYLDRKGRPEAWDLFSRIINLAFIITVAFSSLIILLATGGMAGTQLTRQAAGEELLEVLREVGDTHRRPPCVAVNWNSVASSRSLGTASMY